MKMTKKNSQIIELLVDLGMSERESKVYFAMLNKCKANTGDLQRISGIPQNKIYEVMNSLLRKGYCIESKEGKKRTFEIVDPSITLSTSFDRLEKKLKETKEIKKDIYELYSQADISSNPLDYFEVIHGNDNIHHKYCQLVKRTNEELLGFGRRPYAFNTEEKRKEQDNEEEKMLERGGVQRWVYEINLEEDKTILDDLKYLEKKGLAVKIAKTLPLKMMIFDRKTLFIADEVPYAEKGELVMSIIKQITIINAFCALFEFFWDNSLSIKEWESNREILVNL
jgi:sugar-specific transcriptional regulator TrmB